MLYDIFLGFAGFISGIVLGSFFEHFIHKSLLHSTPKILKNSKYVKSMWKGHTISHHGSYAPDDHYTQDGTNKWEVLTFSWYEGPLIIASATAIAYLIASGIRSLLGMHINIFLPEVVGGCIAFTLYYTAYEGLHAIMHVPHKWRWLRRRRFMVLLNNHHYQHHLDPRTNLNIIIPVADYVWGTKRQLPKEHHCYANAPLLSKS